MSTWEIETSEDWDGDPLVRIISDDDGILGSAAAMAAVGRVVREEFGDGAKVSGRGSSYFDSRGQEAGWQWSVEIGGAR